jgi:hypothetical protein
MMVSRCHHLHFESGVHQPSYGTSYGGKVAGGWGQYVPPKCRWIQDYMVFYREDVNLHSDCRVNLKSYIIFPGHIECSIFSLVGVLY